MDKFCIVIPIYKSELDCIEKISLQRLYDVIGNKNYDVFLLCPYQLDISNYLHIYPSLKQIQIKETHYFKDTKGYSQLLINSGFYELFRNSYVYMYIYQLDCYLFYDDLEEWCDKRYDYVGAPILFGKYCGWKIKDENGNYTPQVGNGGFSLRRISTFIDCCTYIKTHFNSQYLSSIGVEDIFFCNVISDHYRLFIPSWKDALSFSWDMNPDMIYDKYNYVNFPMGAHAIGKNIRFYKYFINELNTKEAINYCEEKYKIMFSKYYQDNRWRTYKT